MNLETMKSQFTGAYREAFDGAYKYILTHSFPASYSDEKMAELYDLLLTAQEEGRPAEKIVGTDIEAFCREYFSDFEPENRLAGILSSLFGVACVLVFFSLVDWLCAEELLPFGQFRLNASPLICGLCCGFVLSAVFRVMQPLVMKTKKISAGTWAVIYCVMLIAAIAAATVLMHGRVLSIPGAPVLICAAVYIVLYLAVSAVIRYRKTGSIRKKKADNPYKDGYYRNLEDKDIRRLIEKGWLKRYRRLAKRGKTTEETFRGEIDRLQKFNGVMQRVYTGLCVLMVVGSTVGVAQDTDLFNTVCYFCITGAVVYGVWWIFHKADKENSAQRAHILADAEASGMTLPAFLAQELNMPLTDGQQGQ